MTLAVPRRLVVAGLAVVTIGFFGAHSFASAWVGRRGGAMRGQAAAWYLFFYYMGSSILGSAGGIAWTHMGWPGVVGFCLMLGLLALIGSVLLFWVRPLTVGPVATPVVPPQA